MLGRSGITFLLLVVLCALVENSNTFKLEIDGGLTDAWKKFSEGWKDTKYEPEGRKAGKEKMRFLLRDRAGQSWKEMKKNGTVPDIWTDDGDVKILIHNFATMKSEDSLNIIREQKILDIGLVYGKKNASLNIIVVDWTSLSVDATDKYPEIMKNVPYAAEAVTELLQALSKADHIKNMGKVHIIGLGLGAHVAGMVGCGIKKEMNDTKINRITGLDPSGPGYDEESGKSSKNETVALDKKDATFVDVIHCNMGKSKDIWEAAGKGRFGSTVQAGHVDFYPNGGEKQTGCTPGEETAEKACSQRKCAQYFADSITEKLVACQCDDWDFFKSGKCKCTEEDGALMGDPVKTSATGRHYITLPKEKEEKDKDKDGKSKKEKEKDKE